MAQTLFLPSQSLYMNNIPSSPDPTPLRLLAFSVAEAALQNDPNSPFLMAQGRMNIDEGWSAPWTQFNPDAEKRQITSGSRLWNVVDSGRRVQTFTTEIETPPSPPLSPAAYNYAPKFPLVASVPLPEKRPTPPSRARLEARLNLASLSKSRPFPLYTRSAEPSPVESTFSGLDQSRPPPEFVPRPAENDAPVSPSAQLRRQATAVPAPSRHTARLPSLAQIQAKMNKAGHRRGNSIGSARDHKIPPFVLPTHRHRSVRTLSEDSVEVLQTPTDESPPVGPRIVFGSPERQPGTPPSPDGSVKESRLAPFLRERTSGRLKTRPVSMPPLSGVDINVFASAFGASRKVTPPKTKSTSGATVPPPSPSRTIILNTPPNRHSLFYSSPSSPTESVRSLASPTLSVPIITCTPAPSRLVKNGVELDSDEEKGDVVLFEGDNADEEHSERERRSKEMLERLDLRRRSR